MSLSTIVVAANAQLLRRLRLGQRLPETDGHDPGGGRLEPDPQTMTVSRTAG
jgi:hypothetical protein